MENSQADLHPFVPSYIPTSRGQQGRIMSAGNNIHPNPVHPHYQLQPRQQQHTSLPPSPHHNHQSSSPYTSFSMNRMNPTSSSTSAPATSYPHSLPPRASSHPASVPPPSSGYLDPYLNMGGVMGMGMDPIQMGSGMDMDLGILSAEEHGDLRMMEERARQQRLQAHQRAGDSMPVGGAGRGRGIGGGVRRKRSDSDDSATDPPLGAARGSNPGNRKQRGRPRLDTKDENAADRRRTQIRLAQRAYRLRKETTISSLRNRVTELETAIDGMQNTFLELHESAMKCLSKSGNPQDGETLKGLTERFLSLAKGALGSAEGVDSPEEDAEGESIHEEDHPQSRVKRRRSRDERDPESGGMQMNGAPGYGGYEVSYARQGNSRDSFDNGGNQNRSGGSGNGRSGGATDHMNSASTYGGSYASSSPESGYESFIQPSAPTSMPAQFQEGTVPYSYPFHETSFSRQLHRATLEHAYYMLTSPNADPRDVARMFAYTFCYVTKEDVVRVVTRLLNTTIKESLHVRDYPELVPKFGRADAAEEYIKNVNMQYSQDILDGEDQEEYALRQEARKYMLEMGLDQKFLRPDEVEKYIMELGILTASHSSPLIDPNLIGVEKSSQSPSPQATPSSGKLPLMAVPEGTADYLTASTMATPEYLRSPPIHASSPGDPRSLQKKLSPFEPDHHQHSRNADSRVPLEGAKKAVDLDAFVNRTTPTYVLPTVSCR